MRASIWVAICLTAMMAAGCQGPTSRVLATAQIPVAAPSLSPFRTVTQAKSFPGALHRDQFRAAIVASIYERLMSHRDIERDAERITNEVAPIVREAVRLPEVQNGLAQFAGDAGMSIEEARDRWAQLQSADLMLESGGDPDAISTSDAVGVAQWLAGTARGVGLKVDLSASNRLTAAITAARCRIAWIEYLNRPDADRSAPGAPAFSPSDVAQLPALRSELETLRGKRRRIDQRYDPRPAIFAQTRYLMRLYDRFPSPQWLFQAYHGGEAGVTRTLRLYLGPKWPGSAALAIRSGADGEPLTFEELLYKTTPSQHTEAFSYLYGRSDDHRHYWYKLLAAEQVLAAYRKSKSDFLQAWETNLPGRRIEAYWYPDATPLGSQNLDALARRTDLVPVSDQPGLVIVPAIDDPANAPRYSKLRPGAKGALLEVVKEFRGNQGAGPLQTADLTLTQEYIDRARILHPPRPARPPIFPPDPDADATIGGGPPRRFDYHMTGIAFDLVRPINPRDRKILEYTLDNMAARGLLAYIDAKDRDLRRYHIIPHPAYNDLFAKHSAGH